MKAKVTMLTVSAVLLMAGSLFAQPVNIPVSCAVPAIPGLNAPMLEKSAEVSTADSMVGEQKKTEGGETKLVKTYYAK